MFGLPRFTQLKYTCWFSLALIVGLFANAAYHHDLTRIPSDLVTVGNFLVLICKYIISFAFQLVGVLLVIGFAFVICMAIYEGEKKHKQREKEFIEKKKAALKSDEEK